MVFQDSIFIFDDIFMIKIFKYSCLFFDASNEIFADMYFFHGYKNSSIEVDAFVDFSKGSLPDLLYELVAINYFTFRKTH